MQTKVTSLKRCVLVEVSGRVDSDTAPQLREELNKITDADNYKIVMDCSKLDFISSAGMWVLVNAQKRCKRFNRGEVVLADIPKKIYDILDLAGFDEVFKFFKSTAEAVGYF